MNQKEYDNQPMTELPRWKCHKIIHGFKITGIDLDSDKANTEGRETDGSAMLQHAERYFTAIRVDHAYMHKHSPQVGGYYVIYDDGYASFSPGKAFEDHYTRI